MLERLEREYAIVSKEIDNLIENNGSNEEITNLHYRLEELDSKIDLAIELEELEADKYFSDSFGETWTDNRIAEIKALLA